MLDKVATYTELTTTMSIDDADLLCIASDLVHDATFPPGGDR